MYSRGKNGFDGYHLIVQEAKKRTNEGSVLFQDYRFNPNFCMIDADTVNGPCFIIESNIQNGFVTLAQDKNVGQTILLIYTERWLKSLHVL